MADLRIERRGSVGLITFDRPHRLNAFTDATRRELHALLEATATDAAIRTLVLTGTGRGFCAGEDLKALAQSTASNRSLHATRESLEMFQDITRAMVSHPKPIIAAINGFAVGFGAELAIAADMRVAAESASFALPECQRALFVTGGALYLLPRMIGYARALDMVLTGRTVSATEALAIGLVTRVVSDASLVSTTVTLAQELSHHAPISLRLAKTHMRRALELDLESTLCLETAAALECSASEDAHEGTRAFVERREPRYLGH